MVLVATQVKRRRGTTAENDAFTGAEGEITVDTEKHELRVHDGTTQGGFKVGSGTGALIIGQILEVVGTADYTPEGCLLTDGAEYTKAQFPDLWADFLTGTPKLQTCTYTEYANQIAEYGFCNKFAVDTTNETFKVPTRNKYRKLVKKIVNGTTWANLYDDGWCEQGGIGDNGSETTVYNYNVVLPIEMANADYHIKVTPLLSSRDTNGGTMGFAYTPTTTGFSAMVASKYQNAGRSRKVFWEVSGYTTIPDSTANITREFVVVANGTLNQEQMDWSAWASSLAGRATTDMSNITSTGKETVVGWGMPDYSAGVVKTHNTLYKAETDGIVRLCIGTNNHNIQFRYGNDSSVSNVLSVTNGAGVTAITGDFFVPKGTYYQTTGTLYVFSTMSNTIIFYPCKK